MAGAPATPNTSVPPSPPPLESRWDSAHADSETASAPASPIRARRRGRATRGWSMLAPLSKGIGSGRVHRKSARGWSQTLAVIARLLKTSAPRPSTDSGPAKRVSTGNCSERMVETTSEKGVSPVMRDVVHTTDQDDLDGPTLTQSWSQLDNRLTPGSNHGQGYHSQWPHSYVRIQLAGGHTSAGRMTSSA